MVEDPKVAWPAKLKVMDDGLPRVAPPVGLDRLNAKDSRSGS